MDSLGAASAVQTPETLHLYGRIRDLEQELSRCQEERSRQQTAAKNFEIFSQNVQDFAFVNAGRKIPVSPIENSPAPTEWWLTVSG